MTKLRGIMTVAWCRNKDNDSDYEKKNEANDMEGKNRNDNLTRKIR